MRYSNKGKLPTETLVKMILLSAFLLIVAGGIFMYAKTGMEPEALQNYGCWANNAIKSSASIFRLFLPETCAFQTLEQPVKEEELAELLRNTWWMYGKGQWNLAWKANIDETYPQYAFSIEKKINIEELTNYLISHSQGEKVEATNPDSDWNYLQKGAERNTLCLDKETFTASQALQKNTLYFIIFYDERSFRQRSLEDRLIITSNANFGLGWIEKFTGDVVDEKCIGYVKEEPPYYT